jgi:methylmalonyl-CoA mutase cobalamin-binding subunit
LSWSRHATNLEELIPEELPQGRDVIREGIELGESIQIGKSAFLAQEGVQSELEYKLRLKKEGRISTHAHFGLNTVEATVEGLRFLHEQSLKRGIRIDRFGLSMNPVMGLPSDMRSRVPKGTGPILWKDEDWITLAQAAPIQPHFGDFCIGSPASVSNTVLALRAGGTTIGNLAQYFTFEYAEWVDLKARTIETVKALGIMAALKRKGTLVHSYIDDGYGGIFSDYGTVAGWGMLERYIVETLVGGKLAHCFGGLTSDPITRLAWQRVLDDIHGQETVGSMFYGNTIDLGEDLERNVAISSSCSLIDIMGQLRNPTAHAIMPVPKTEPIRIPSPKEVLEAQIHARQMEKEAKRLLPVISFDQSDSLAARMVAEGKRFFESTLKGLKQMGVDVGDPLELLFVLKRLGAHKVERIFGLGERDEVYPCGRKPILETDMIKRTIDIASNLTREADQSVNLKGLKVLVGSTDVHEYSLLIMARLLDARGAQVTNLGPNLESPKWLVKAVSESHPSIVVLTTHNGKALEYGKGVIDEMQRTRTSSVIVMGGVLNQNVGGEMPKDVTVDLNRLGIVTCTNLAELPTLLRTLPMSSSNAE